MSLLLDALKRAEQEKLAREAQQRDAEDPRAGTPAQAQGLQLQPIEPPAPGSPAPVAHRGVGPPPTYGKRTDLPGANLAASSSRKPLIAAAVVIVLLVAAGGVYIWRQIATLSSPPIAARPAPVVKPVTPAGAPAAPSAPTAAAPASPPAVAVVKPESVTPDARKTPPVPRAAEQRVMDLLRGGASEPAAPALKLAKSLDPPRVLPDVAAGYGALQRGDLRSAKRSYEAAFASDPASADAVLGLATVEARAGNRAVAARHYRRALELEPRNATALAGLAALADFSRPAMEAGLKADIARYPESAALHFALGNFYASRARWSDAQAAFFEAHRLEPENADVLHNLAVSLDHLGQGRLAVDFYQRAVARAAAQPVQFDARAAERRLAELRR